MDESSPEFQFNKMMEKKQEMANKAQPLPGGGQPPQTQQAQQAQVSSIEEQRIISEVKNNAPYVPSTAPSQGQCPQCNLFHPPLGPGEKCPNAPVDIEGVSEKSITEFVVKVKDILSSQLEQKEIKDYDKFIGGMIVALMKYSEEYKE